MSSSIASMSFLEVKSMVYRLTTGWYTIKKSFRNSRPQPGCLLPKLERE
jgi:hypothetical protein